MGMKSKNMYKTLKHGENSLQYTILSQNDDICVEGKIKSVGSDKEWLTERCKKTRDHRRSFFAYLGVTFVCTVMAGVVLIPFLVSSEFIPNPKEWFSRTKQTFSNNSWADVTKLNNTYRESANSEHGIFSTLLSNRDNLVLSNNHVNIDKTMNIFNQNGIQNTIFNVNRTKTIDSPKQLTKSLKEINNNESIKAEVIVVPNMNNNSLEQNISYNAIDGLSNSKFLTPIKKTINEQNNHSNQSHHLELTEKYTKKHSFPMTNMSSPTLSIFTAITLQVVNSTSFALYSNHLKKFSLLNNTNSNKRFGLPPVLAKNYSKSIPPIPFSQNAKPLYMNTALQHNSNGTTNVLNNSETKTKWISNHWPYINASTYFQWNVRLLFPILLSFGFIGIFLFVIVCITTCNKHSALNTVRKPNRRDAKTNTSEDNATLLTKSLSDDDE